MQEEVKMQNKKIAERLIRLRQIMAQEKIDFYMIPTADYHGSEYVNDYFKVREYFSGFSGSNGTLLVWQEGAGLWTDGRYFVQAEKELAGTGISLFRMLEEGVPTIREFLQDNMEDGQTLGFDGRVIPAQGGKELEEALAVRGIGISYDKDLSEMIWTDRPAFPGGIIRVLPSELTGKSVEEKLAQLRKEMERAGAESTFLSRLDDIMWIFNIRGCDVECNPVAMSYAYISDSEAMIFLQECALTGEVREYLTEHGICLKAYNEAMQYLDELSEGLKILVDLGSCSYAVYQLISEGRKLIRKKNPVERLKAVKNPVELSHMRETYLSDSVAVTKFICWLKKHVGMETLSEISAAEYLDGLRRQIPGFLDLSFPTIAAYGENAAMLHYHATPENCARLLPEGLLLVDSGGQYLGGTTDVTRTIVLGPVSDEIKKQYTLTAAGMLQLTHAAWLYGCTGRNLDILARQPLWEIGMDYRCGTGHGIGYILNVHEGPQNVRWRFGAGLEEAVLESGMVVTNEPGVYVEGSHGIRIENVLAVCDGEKNEYGQFMHFETLTFVPIDLEAIDICSMSDVHRRHLNNYHRQVFEKVSPYLDAEEREWLRAATREI